MNTSVYVREAIDGDAESLSWVIQHFQPLIEAQIRMRLGGRGGREDVEDLVNETWVVTLARLRDLEEREGRMAPVLVRFLGSTCLRLCNNALRAKIRRTRKGADPAEPRDMDEFARLTRGVVTRVLQKDMTNVVRATLDSMEGDKRDVLVYRLVENRTNPEIADILGVTPHAVAMRYKRAREELRRALPAEVADDLFAEDRDG